MDGWMDLHNGDIAQFVHPLNCIFVEKGLFEMFRSGSGQKGTLVQNMPPGPPSILQKELN